MRGRSDITFDRVVKLVQSKTNKYRIVDSIIVLDLYQMSVEIYGMKYFKWVKIDTFENSNYKSNPPVPDFPKVRFLKQVSSSLDLLIRVYDHPSS